MMNKSGHSVNDVKNTGDIQLFEQCDISMSSQSSTTLDFYH